MLRGLYTAYTRMVNQQKRMDTMTNNLANVNTVGFKKEGATNEAFSDVLAYRLKDVTTPGGGSYIGQMNLGVKIGENYTDWTQGAFRNTENTYDVALSGNGFFSIEFTNKNDETMTLYTRDGGFTVNTARYLVNDNGDYVLGGTAGGGLERIQLDPTKDSYIDQLGGIYQDDELVATLQITDFTDYNYLAKYGENYYQAIEGAEMQEADARVHSGYLEQSNVESVQEMVNMITIQRNYEANQKVITTLDRSLDIAVNQIGKV